ncbi:MAG: zinc-binding dehydrogenase [Deltaproteobacteria bacterium]
MKAAVIEKFGSVVVREIAEPKMGDYDALCELLYGATCTGTDSHIIEGSFPWIGKLPTVPGHESVGRVISIGKKVRNFKVGDLVTRVGTPPTSDGKFSVTWGGFAQMGIAKDHWAMCADGLPAAEWNDGMVRANQIVPPSVDPRVAPMFTTWRETLSLIKRFGVSGGSNIIIAGSGGNGLAFAAHCAILGATVAMVGSPKREQSALAAGVKHYFSYGMEDMAGTVLKSVPEGFDFALDALGRKGIAEQLLACLKSKGKLTIYGIDDFGKISINPGFARGEFIFCKANYSEAETHQDVSELVLQGKLDANIWYDVEKAYPLSEIAAAFEDVKKSPKSKMLIKLK